MQALDYSLARPDPAAIVAAGYVGVLRYLAPEIDAPKIITPVEYENLIGHGLKVVLNWEWYGNRAREGAAAGTADAQEALRQANELGYTGCIYFSVDYDAPPADQPAINAYFQACAQVLGLARLGAYGGYWPLSRLFDAGLIRYGWQTFAWSGGNRESRAHLYQNGATVFDGGADVNDILQPDWTGEFMIPQGWTDDGAKLTAPNGHFFQAGFRNFVLAANWDTEDWPLEEERSVPHMEISGPNAIPGVIQTTRKNRLLYSPEKNNGQPFLCWTGMMLLLTEQARPTGTPRLVMDETSIRAVLA